MLERLWECIKSLCQQEVIREAELPKTREERHDWPRINAKAVTHWYFMVCGMLALLNL